MTHLENAEWSAFVEGAGDNDGIDTSYEYNLRKGHWTS